MKTARDLAEYVEDGATCLPPRISIEEVVDQISALHAGSNGATVSMYFGDMSGKPGFAVSLFPGRTSFVLGDALTKQRLAAFIIENVDFLLADPRHCIGTWYDQEGDVSYIDITAVVPESGLAMDLAVWYNQVAIYDLAKQVVTPAGGTGEELPGWPPEAERLPPLQRKGIDNE